MPCSGHLPPAQLTHVLHICATIERKMASIARDRHAEQMLRWELSFSSPVTTYARFRGFGSFLESYGGGGGSGYEGSAEVGALGGPPKEHARPAPLSFEQLDKWRGGGHARPALADSLPSCLECLGATLQLCGALEARVGVQPRAKKLQIQALLALVFLECLPAPHADAAQAPARPAPRL